MADLKLKILMEAVDRVTAPIRAIRGGAAKLNTDVAKTTEKLRNLEATSRQLTKFRELKDEARRNATALETAQGKCKKLASAMAEAGATSKTLKQELATATKEAAKLAKEAKGDAVALEAAQAKVKSLTAAMEKADKATRSLTKQFGASVREAGKLKDAQQRGAQELQKLRGGLQAAGVSTRQMASEQRRLKSDIAQTTAQADRQAAALERLTTRAKAMATARAKMDKVQTIAGSMAGAGAAGLATGGGGLATAAHVAKVGIEFEAMMSRVSALSKVDKTSDAFAKLEKQAFDLGAQTSYSAYQAAEAMSNLAMAGFDAEKILGVMPGMLNLAKAGNTDLAQTAGITAAIMAGYGLQASQMGDVGDVLVATFTGSNTTLESLGETMKYVGPIAKAAGYSLGDMAVMTGLLGNAGIQGSKAGTALRMALVRLAAPPKAAQKQLAALGISTKDVVGNMRPMAAVLAELADKTKTLGNAQKIDIFSKIFGVEAASAMTELVQQAGADGIKQFTAEINKAHGLNDKMSAQMADNAKGDLDNLSSALEGVAIILTKINTKPLRDLASWATDIVTALGNWMLVNPQIVAGMTQVSIVIAAVIAAGGALAITIAGILGPFAILRFTLVAVGIQLPALVGGFLALGRAIIMGVIPALWSMTAALLANPITWVVAAIAAAAAVFIIGWEPIAAFFTDLWGQVSVAFGAGWAWITDKLGFDPLAAIAPYWEPVAAFFTDLWARVPAILTAAWDLIKTVFSFTPLGIIIGNWEPIAGFFGDLWARVPATITAAWEGIKTIFGFTPLGIIIGNWEPIAAFFADLWARAPATITAAWEGIKSLFGFTPLGLIVANWEPIAAFFSNLWDGILAKLNATWDAIAAKVASIKGVVDWAGETWNSLFGDSKPGMPTAANGNAATARTVTPPISIVPTPAVPASSPDSRTSAAAPVINQTISITVHAAPGMTAEDVAREVRRQFEQQASRQRSTARSSLFDAA